MIEEGLGWFLRPLLRNAHAFFTEAWLRGTVLIFFTGSDLAYQKESIGDFYLILGTNLGHRQNFEGKFLILLISKDRLM